MKTVLFIAFALVALAAFLPMLKASFTFRPLPLGLTCNASVVPPPEEGALTLYPTPAHAAGVLVKWGADQDHYAVCGASDEPIGIVRSAVLAGDLTARKQTVYLLGAWKKPENLTCAAAVAFTDHLYTAANGQVQKLPVTTGTYYLVGRPLSAGASGGLVPAQHIYPVSVSVA